VSLRRDLIVERGVLSVAELRGYSSVRRLERKAMAYESSREGNVKANVGSLTDGRGERIRRKKVSLRPV